MNRSSYGIADASGTLFGESENDYVSFGSPREADIYRKTLFGADIDTLYVIELPDRHLLRRNDPRLIANAPVGDYCIRAKDDTGNDYYVSETSEQNLIFRDLFGENAFRFPSHDEAAAWMQAMVPEEAVRHFRVTKYENISSDNIPFKKLLADYRRLLRERSALIKLNRGVQFEIEVGQYEHAKDFGVLSESHYALTAKTREVYRAAFGRNAPQGTSPVDMLDAVKESVGALESSRLEIQEALEKPTEVNL